MTEDILKPSISSDQHPNIHFSLRCRHKVKYVLYVRVIRNFSTTKKKARRNDHKFDPLTCQKESYEHLKEGFAYEVFTCPLSEFQTLLCPQFRSLDKLAVIILMVLFLSQLLHSVYCRFILFMSLFQSLQLDTI